MASGCPQTFNTTTQPNPPICANQPPGPAVCVHQNPGNGKKIEPGINQWINGSTGASMCASPNYWTSPNSIYAITHENPPDPRLVNVLIVDTAAWVGVSGATTQTPERQIATFYITGWSGPPATSNNNGGDPCSLSLLETSNEPPASTSKPSVPLALGHATPGAELVGCCVPK